MAEEYSIVYMDHNFFIHSSVNRHLGCFHVLAIVNSAAMNIGIHVSFSILVSSGYMPRRGISGSSVQFSSDTQSCLTLCDPMNCSTPPVNGSWPPCPSSTPGVHSDSCPSSQGCHPALSSCVVPFSSCPQSLPASKSFPMSQLFA